MVCEREGPSASGYVHALHVGGWRAHHVHVGSVGACAVPVPVHPHILTFVSQRPLGVSIMKAGGLKGYSAGSRMRPWYTPPWGWGWGKRVRNSSCSQATALQGSEGGKESGRQQDAAVVHAGLGVGVELWVGGADSNSSCNQATPPQGPGGGKSSGGSRTRHWYTRPRGRGGRGQGATGEGGKCLRQAYRRPS